MKHILITILFLAMPLLAGNFFSHSPHWQQTHYLGLEIGFSPDPVTNQVGYSFYSNGFGISVRRTWTFLYPAEDPDPDRPEWTFRMKDKGMELGAGVLTWWRLYGEISLVHWNPRFGKSRVKPGFAARALFRDCYLQVRWNDIYKWSFNLGIHFK